MDKLTVIKGVECYIDKDGIVQLRLEHVARGLGFTDTSKGTEYIRWNTVKNYLADMNYSQEVAKDTFIPEPIFYLLAMKANNPVAKEFQRIVAYEILPEIRKTGMYIPQGLSKELQAIFITDQKVQHLESHVAALDEKVDNQITVTYNQANEIQRAVASRVIELLGGKETKDYKNHKGSYFQQLHRDLKDRLGVPSYRDIRKIDYDKAVDYIKAWLPKATKIA